MDATSKMIAQTLDALQEHVVVFEEAMHEELKTRKLEKDKVEYITGQIQLMKDVTNLLKNSKEVQNSDLGILLTVIVTLMMQRPVLAKNLLHAFSNTAVKHLMTTTLEGMK